MEYITFIILILIILSIYKKGSKSYFDIPTVDEYLEQNPQCNTGYGIRCVKCGSKSIKNQGLIKTLEYIYEQFDGIDTNYENLILAYEPVWAIGTGVTATNEDIKQVHNAIKSKINKPLLYGGSVKVENVKEICEIENVDGALIGTASWKIEDFIKILENTKDIR